MRKKGARVVMDTIPNINIGLNQTDEMSCNECGVTTFTPVFLLRKVSALVSPTGKETVFPIQVFACSSCGHVNKDFLPIEKD